MSNAKKYDLAVKVGEYEKNGEKKGRYKNIGTVFEGDKGMYLLLDSTVISMQLFALVNKDRRDSIIVSMFEPKGEGERKAAGSAAPAAGADPEDEIPF
jgi:hypothetical protein